MLKILSSCVILAAMKRQGLLILLLCVYETYLLCGARRFTSSDTLPVILTPSSDGGGGEPLWSGGLLKIQQL